MSFSRFSSGIVITACLVNSVATADGIQIADLANRCEQDSLNPSQAGERIEWWIRCQPAVVNAFITEREGGVYTDEVAANLLRRSVLLRSDGQIKARPSYPTFADTAVSPRAYWSAPMDRNASCEIPANMQVFGMCTSSCYKPEVRVLFGAGYTPIKQARDSFLENVVVVSEGSSLERLNFRQKKVASYTESMTETEHRITVLKMDSGGVLKVTANHPLVDALGRMREAETLSAGESLVRTDGTADRIVQISVEPYFGKVYNVAPQGDNLQENIVVAEGYLSGSSWYQNDGAENLNRFVMRFRVPDELVK